MHAPKPFLLTNVEIRDSSFDIQSAVFDMQEKVSYLHMLNLTILRSRIEGFFG